jgi:pyruvate/2-oxoglutarate/acetoin dehydrogenase E1 component/TPP-dependent pyruvate/acetoin dehydrogenase alpha subunit
MKSLQSSLHKVSQSTLSQSSLQSLPPSSSASLPRVVNGHIMNTHVNDHIRHSDDKHSNGHSAQNANKKHRSTQSQRKQKQMSESTAESKEQHVQHDVFNAADVIRDYRIAYQSRQMSLMGRREVLGGKGKFGIFGDGKEVAQLAMARVFREGDFRSGYYRDQTFMLAAGMVTVQQLFAQIYAHCDVEAEPATAGRTMNSHFATRSLNPDGSWRVLSAMKNSSADLSPTAAQMPRLVGLAYASRLYREVPELANRPESAQFSHQGREIAFGTIGNASCAEGPFWESVNAIGVLHAPALISIWDDEYGISVPNKYQITKQSISEVLSGFRRTKQEDGTWSSGYEIFVVKGWDYPALIETYQRAADIVRHEGSPVIVHVVELTQPQGHSTSGSHERYKSKERLAWEREYDCLVQFRSWIIQQGLASDAELKGYEQEDFLYVRDCKDRASEAYSAPIKQDVREVAAFLERMAAEPAHAGYAEALRALSAKALAIPVPDRKDAMIALNEALVLARFDDSAPKRELQQWFVRQEVLNADRYNSHLYSVSDEAASRVPEVPVHYAPEAESVTGFSILNACFEAAFKRDPRLVAFGEDVGYLGDVNQAFAGLQAKFGELRISDTGIRECTIVGQAIGLAMRGLRPIAEIQYLDYLLYALQIMSDDLATLQYRTKGGQKAPVIIRTRGHRLEGVWHSGSPMSGIINFVRGIHVLVPRNMTQAAGFYNTLLRSDEPGLVIEVLNGYRLKEQMPSNIGEFTIPLGVPEILRAGTDTTIVTYGATVRLALEAAEKLSAVGIHAEVIDVRSLLPFDVSGVIVSSLKKTNRIIFVDEDVPGGCTAYMMQQVLERDGGYRWLDALPKTLPGAPHRPAYGTDGNYWSKPDVEHIFRAAYEQLHEVRPAEFPLYL